MQVTSVYIVRVQQSGFAVLTCHVFLHACAWLCGCHMLHRWAMRHAAQGRPVCVTRQGSGSSADSHKLSEGAAVCHAQLSAAACCCRCAREAAPLLGPLGPTSGPTL
jgi:hypothetical protein